ncbi:hypothetical protein CSB45_01030 [candidate division KSB3 bacterium]|uniref:Ice-binding protein C-terminal domain-containing protein n=1 Tax=candidate division KSB3 bacterium TaxID=2044937 RepID=A0A2G6EAB2_9BACT|nr:MAG: hypothetical protein CSB45_01030 [candidate division KSB3 bacterium]PIE30813.1 MAG: hypothetical protein CSA57_02320 [candidate division KSB3 bacterium]
MRQFIVTRTRSYQKEYFFFNIFLALMTCLVLIISGQPEALAKPFNDAYSYLDQFEDETGLNPEANVNISVFDGKLVAETTNAEAVSECIQLPQPEGGAFQGWSSAIFSASDFGQSDRVEIQDCAGNTLVSSGDFSDGEAVLDLSAIQTNAIRLKWIAAQAGSSLESWGVYGKSSGVTEIQISPATNPPKAGDTVTFAIHVSSNGAITHNPIVRVSLDDINGLHTPDIDDGLAEDAEMDYGSGVKIYKPLEFVSASLGPEGEKPITPAMSATSGEIIWNLNDFSDGFSEELTLTLRIPRGSVDGKTIATKVSLEHGISTANRMIAAATSEAAAIQAVQAVHQRSWSPYSFVGPNAQNIYEWYLIWNHKVDSPHASDIEDVTMSISSISGTGKCQPIYQKIIVRNPYDSFQIIQEPEAGSPLTVDNPVIIHFDRADFHNERTGAAVYYSIPADCPAGNKIVTQSDIDGTNPQWSDHSEWEHQTPLPGASVCRSGANTTMRTASGRLYNTYERWPAWDEFHIHNGSIKAGEYFITESPRGVHGYRTQVSTIEKSYVLIDIPPETTFHGVRDFETPYGSWLSHLYKDCSGTAPGPKDGDFDHEDPTNSGWFPVDIAWEGAPFTDAPDNLNERAVVTPGCRLLGVKEIDNPAWVGPDYGNWDPFFIWRICDGQYDCQEPPNGTKMSLVGGRIYTYSADWEEGTRDCGSYAGWPLYKENVSWPKVYSWAEESQVAAGKVAHVILSPENQNLASMYPEGHWGFNLYEVRQYVDLTALSGEIVSQGFNIPQPDQNIMGEVCHLEEIVFHLPDAQACLEAASPDDPSCMAFWEIPSACQPPNGWGHRLEGIRNHNEYIEMYRLRLNLPILKTTPANTMLNVKAEIRSRNLLQPGADNAVSTERWASSNYTSVTQVKALEVPGLDADLTAPVSKNIGDDLTYTLKMTNSGNAPNDGIYGILQLPKQGINGSEFTPDYGQVYLDRSAGDMLVEYTTESACFTHPNAANWTPLALQATTRIGYQAESIAAIASDAACVRIRRHPSSSKPFNPGDSLLSAYDLKIPDESNLEGKWLYSRALSGADPLFGAETEVAPVETVSVRTLVGSEVVVTLEKSAEIDPSRAGYVKWTLRVSNSSGSTARKISLVDKLPDELIYQGLAGNLAEGWTCLNASCAVSGTNADGSGGTLGFMIESLTSDDGNPGSGSDEGVISFWTQVKDNLPDGAVIENHAWANPESGTGAEAKAQVTTAQIDAVKTQTAVDRFSQNSIMDVFAGDFITYTITAINSFEQSVEMMIHDALNSYVDYVAGTLSVNGATVSDGFVSDGLLEYRHAEPIASGESLTLSFDVQVDQDVSDGWVIENIATVTAYPLAGSGFIPKQTNETYAKVKVAVPEPSTLLFIGTGVFGLSILLRKKRRGRK